MTIKDIAERASVSITAVSFALNGRKGVSEETRRRVLAVADEMGWSPTSAARSLAGATTETFGLVLARDPENLGVESFYMRFLSGLESVLAPRSFGLQLQVVPSREQEIVTQEKWRSSRRVDGLILVDLTVDDPRIPIALKPGALPTVLVVTGADAAPGLTSVWTDDAASMRETVRHLADLGHHRIARVAGLAPFMHTHTRNEAFRNEMLSRGLEPIMLRADYTPAEGARATRAVLQSDRPPTALIYDNDIMAVAGLSVANQLGLRVPVDLSIVAWDDSVLCEHTFPTLTAVSHDVVAFGAHAARRLFDVVAGAAPGAFKDATPHVVPRGSTGPA